MTVVFGLLLSALVRILLPASIRMPSLGLLVAVSDAMSDWMSEFGLTLMPSPVVLVESAILFETMLTSVLALPPNAVLVRTPRALSMTLEHRRR